MNVENPQSKKFKMLNCGRGCSVGFNVRCCCEPFVPNKNTIEMLRACPMRINTMVFLLSNCPDRYNRANAGDFSWLCQFGFSDTDKREIIKCYKEEQLSECDEEEFCACEEGEQNYFYRVEMCRNCGFTSGDPNVILCPDCEESPCFAVDVCATCGFSNVRGVFRLILKFFMF